MKAPVLLFDAFSPASIMGRASERLDHSIVASWKELYPCDVDEHDYAPAGLSTVLIMRAYMRVLTPRPPGNIHVRQKVEVAALPRLGEEVATEIRCVGKALRRECRYVELETKSTGEGGRDLFTGAMTLIWAA